MIAYIGYLCLIGFQIPLFKKKDIYGKKYFCKKKYLFLCCIELIILTGIRGYNIGADTPVYLGALDYYSRLPLQNLLTARLVWPFDFEIGYFALTKICVLFGFGKTAYLFIVATLIYVPVFMVIRKYSLLPFISILCYFAFGMFEYSLGIFRQMIALSIVLCGWEYVEKRQLGKYGLVVGVAMLFHTTAVLCILLYIIYGMNWKRIIWVLPSVEIIFMLFGRYILTLVFKIVPKYAGYMNGVYDQRGGSYTMLFLLNIVLYLCVFLWKKNDSHRRITICALVIAVCFQALGYSMGLFGRVVPYFSVYLMFAIPGIICSFNREWKSIVCVFVMVCLFVFVYLQLNGNEYVTPYYTFFTATH